MASIHFHTSYTPTVSWSSCQREASHSPIFSDAYPSEPDEDIFPELAFARYVEEGNFVKREFVEPVRGPAPKDHPHIRDRLTMRFLADENFPGDAVTALRASGHDVVWIRTENT
jgi:hypothetical protein